MKILYDFQIFSLQDFGGISRYFIELIHHLEAEKDIKTELAIYFSNNSYLRRSHSLYAKPFLSNTNLFWKNIIIEKINKILCGPRINKKDYDIFHPTYYDTYFLSLIGKKPFVLTVYDMIHEHYEEIRSVEKTISEQKRRLVQKASKVIAISENTKQDLLRYFHANEKKIEVVHLGNSVFPKPIAVNHRSIPEKFILYVGVRSFYKNFKPFLSSMVPLLTKDENLHLLCAGGGDFRNEEISLFKNAGVDKKVIHYPIDDNLLGHLYRNARVFVFPSLYEGFGIPVLEAFGCGCPVVLSNSSSLPEIGKDAALYFDPQEEQSIRNTVESVLYNEDIRKELIARGFERVKEFSWGKTARETRRIYESLV